MPDTFASFLIVAMIITASSLGATLDYSTTATPATRTASAIAAASAKRTTPGWLAESDVAAEEEEGAVREEKKEEKEEDRDHGTSTKEAPKRMGELVWECPSVTGVGLECSCDFPHTLRCIGDGPALQVR
jgi:hypothetical protein